MWGDGAALVGGGEGGCKGEEKGDECGEREEVHGCWLVGGRFGLWWWVWVEVELWLFVS